MKKAEFIKGLKDINERFEFCISRPLSELVNEFIKDKENLYKIGTKFDHQIMNLENLPLIYAEIIDKLNNNNEMTSKIREALGYSK